MKRIRLYQTVRSAHLERAHELEPASIVYQTRRYDFDDSLAGGLHLVQARTSRAAWIIARSRVTALEINEPLMLSSLLRSAVVLIALRFAGRPGRMRPVVVTYAIGNADPFGQQAPTGSRARIRRALDRVLLHYVWGRVDRIAFGTDAARDVYRRVLPPPGRGMTTTMIPALPSPYASAGISEKDSYRVVFVGAFSNRKGFSLLADAWPSVSAAIPEARLGLLGKGALEPRARELAGKFASVHLAVDPSREEIHRQLEKAQVLVLASQPTATWKEQVGLPIVEGLMHGCSIVTTTESGLASWLADHGHAVLEPGGSAIELARAIERMLRERRPPADILRSLPEHDGRLEADRWLFAGTDD